MGAEAVQDLDAEIVTSLRDADARAVAESIRALDPRLEIESAPTPDVDWKQAWRERISAHRVGRLVVSPPWLAHQFGDAERVVVEPGMAFGTGEHETTRGVLRLMQQVLRRGDLVADLGAGSAVLAIAAAKLGAGRAVAIELDPDAIGNAEDNVHRNGVGDRVTVIEGDAAVLLQLVAPVNVVLANIISSVLVGLLPSIRQSLAPGGRVILSGILREEQSAIRQELLKGGWEELGSDAEGLWWTVAVSPR